MQTVNYQRFQLSPGDVILDLGCGEGRHVVSAWLEEDITAIGVDLCLDDVKTTLEKQRTFSEYEKEEKNFGLSVGNALQLPFADNTFDTIICSELLEHIPDYEGA